MAEQEQQVPVIKYNPQLDGLRFFAVFFVVCYHWLPSISENDTAFFFGGFVNFFFVLSSYLITKILFSAKDKSRVANIPRYQVMLVFLMRRTVRIFPAYYVFLIVVMCLPSIGYDLRENAGSYFAYIANYTIYFKQSWPPVTSHIWTLAVEEQFYLLWPFVILFIPKRYLAKTFFFIILASLLARAVFFEPGRVIPQVILTQYAIDPFAIGGLLAYLYAIPEDARKDINKYLNIALYLAIPTSIAIIISKSYYFSFVLNGLCFSSISLKIIEGAILGYKGFLGKLLVQRVVLFIGKISYSIYLYHLLVPILFWKVFNNLYGRLIGHFPYFFADHKTAIDSTMKFLASEPVRFVLYSGVLMLFALFSWNVIEKPINKFKVAFKSGPEKQNLNSAGS